MSAISFWAIVGIFLGSAVVRAQPKLNLNHIKVAYFIAIICYWLAWYYGYPVMNNLEISMQGKDEMFEFMPSVALFPSNMAQLFLYAGAYVFPAFFLISFLLPWVCNHLQADRRHLGLAYGLNTLAFCIGLISFTLIAPMVSIFYSLKLMFVLLIAAALLLQLMREDQPLKVWKPVVVMAAFGFAAFLVPGKFDRNYVNPGLPAANFPVTAMKSNGAVTSYVLKAPAGKYLFFGNVSMSGTSDTAQTYMRLMAHFPLLAQQNPEKALLICFGVGNTASAIAKHETITDIDVVDLNVKVFETAPEFSDTNNNVIDDQRIRLINDDGRAYISMVDKRYDLITSEPPPPMAAGVYRLYSRENYKDVIDHLKQNEMMTQWLPYYQMPPEAVARAIKSFIDVFPHTLLFVGRAEELILVGSPQPINLNTISERFFEMPSVVEDLRRIVINDPLDLFSRIMQFDGELRENYADAGMISDQHNHLEQVFLRTQDIPVISYNPARVLEEVSQQYPEVGAELAPVISNMGRLSIRVPDFPLHKVVPNERIKYSDVDWRQIRTYKRRGSVASSRNDPVGAANALLAGLQEVPEHTLFLSFLGQIYLSNNQPADAEAAFRRLVTLEPSNADLRVFLAKAIAEQGMGKEAVAHFRLALQLDPELESALLGLSRILATHPDASVRAGDEALSLAEHANSITGDPSPEVLRVLASAYAVNGRFEDATKAAERAIRIAGQSAAGAIGALISRDLVLYRKRQPVVDMSIGG